MHKSFGDQVAIFSLRSSKDQMINRAKKIRELHTVLMETEESEIQRARGTKEGRLFVRSINLFVYSLLGGSQYVKVIGSA